jgi:Na+/H+ antiporter NhaD/arsenite permease-like protein
MQAQYSMHTDSSQPDTDRSHHGPAASASPRGLLVLLALALVGYVGAVGVGWPQYARDQIVAAKSAHASGEHGTDRLVPSHDNAPPDDPTPSQDPTQPGADAGASGHAPDPAAHRPGTDGHPADTTHADTPHVDGSHADVVAPPLATVLPFLCLLGAIAVLPLVPALAHWWEHNSSRLAVACGLALVTLLYYGLFHRHPVELHFPAHAITPHADSGISWGVVATILANAILSEYVPFIMLLFSLYCVTGGVRIEGDLAASPEVNTSFITIGGLLASCIGTTGAAMLLVRPLLETNRERRQVAHTMVFFIFVVCNCGGCLLPIGDPPLFLGYLEGVDFFWTLSLWPEWLFVNVVLVAIYWTWDRFFAVPREREEDLRRDLAQVRPLAIRGIWPSAPLLVAVILAVALLDPSKTVPGTNWHPWVFLREAVLAGIVLISLATGDASIRRDNGFSFGAIAEVAALFLGIFICMQPALAILDEQGASLGVQSPRAFFWATGSLSAVLDNAPTYLVFFKTAQTLPADPGSQMMAGVETARLTAISLGAVFLGAMTYIGNGPNFMVKAIAEQSGVRMPSFFGYVGYSLAILLPVFLATSLLFL